MTRPSELIGLIDPYVAYCFDEAVYAWGIYVESEVQAAVEKAKPKQKDRVQEQTLNKLLDAPVERRFKSFRGQLGKVPIRE